MRKHVLALDLGTTKTKAVVLGPEAEVLGEAQAAARWELPGPGRIEQDPEALWALTLGVTEDALRRTGVAASELAAIGITGQRASFVVWDRRTGRPLSPVVGWQDARGAARAEALTAAGHPMMHVQSAAKLEAVLEDVLASEPGARDHWVFGDVPSFVIHRLTGGRHVTDASLAQATAYLDPITGEWNQPLLQLQQLDPERFPQVLSTRDHFGTTTSRILGAEVPILAAIGDQQAACWAQRCEAPGTAKVTYGTSAIANICTGTAAPPGAGGYPLLMWRIDGVDSWGLEGMVVTAGAVLDHLVRLGVLPGVDAVDEIAASAPDAGGVHLLPAFEGLGTPFMDPHRTGTVVGLRLGSTPGHLVRAALDGIAFRVRQVIEALAARSGVPVSAIRADGGASASDALMQAQSDATGAIVERLEPRDAAAYGAGLLAGQQAGLWPDAAPPGGRRVDRAFEPRGSAAERDGRFAAWREAFALRWA